MQRTLESGLALDRVGVEGKLTDFRPARRPGQPGEYPCRGGKYVRQSVARLSATRPRAGYPTRGPDRRHNDLVGSHPVRSALRTDAGSTWVCDALYAVRDEY
jgi:hypothetical protein